MKIEANLTPELVNVINELVKLDIASLYTEYLGDIKDFYIRNWHLLTNCDDKIKDFLIKICDIQDTLSAFIQEEGGAQ